MDLHQLHHMIFELLELQLVVEEQQVEVQEVKKSYGEVEEVPREGKYIFLVRDNDDRYALTNEVQVNQASRYAVEVTKVDLTCATQHGGSISAKFLESNVPSPSVKLEKYKTDGTMDTNFPAQNNLAGQFNNLSAGKYRVTLSYLFNSGGG